MTFRLRHLVAALVLHVLLFGLLAGGAQCSAKPVRPPPIQGVLLDASRQQVADQKKRDEAERRRREDAARRKQEQEAAEKKQREEQKRQEAIAEQKRKDAEALRQKQAAEAKKKADDARKKAEETKKQKDLAEKKKADEAAKKKKEQQEAKEREAAAQRELQDKLRLEDEMRQEAMKRELDREANARAASEKAQKQSEWGEQLRRAVERRWTRPSTVTQDFKCKVHVVMLPDGSVSVANVVESCGNAALDKSVEDAVYRASPLPKPADPSVFDRDLIINFQPQLQQ